MLVILHPKHAPTHAKPTFVPGARATGIHGTVETSAEAWHSMLALPVKQVEHVENLRLKQMYSSVPFKHSNARIRTEDRRPYNFRIHDTISIFLCH